MDRKERILNFLSRCQDGSSEPLNIAKYLGLSAVKDVRHLLQRMASEGLVENTHGCRWKLCRADSPPNAVCRTSDAEIFITAAAASSSPVLTESSGRTASTGQLRSTDTGGNNAVVSKRSSLPVEQSGRRPDVTVSNTMYAVCREKVPTFKLSVTLTNLNRFSKFLQCWKACEIGYKPHMTMPTSPSACCYTTL